MNGVTRPTLYIISYTKHEARCKTKKKAESKHIFYKKKKKHEVRPILALLHVKYCPNIEILPVSHRSQAKIRPKK